MKSTQKGLAIAVLAAGLGFSTQVSALEEGGYAGTKNEGHDTVVFKIFKNNN